MAKKKEKLKADLETAHKRIAELSQSNQSANNNINNNEPPSWLKTFLEAQSESQRQMQQIIERFSQQQLTQSERTESREQTADINSFNNEAWRTKADAQKRSTLQVGISLDEFSKWRKSLYDLRHFENLSCHGAAIEHSIGIAQRFFLRWKCEKP